MSSRTGFEASRISEDGERAITDGPFGYQLWVGTRLESGMFDGDYLGEVITKHAALEWLEPDRALES